jgi:hypothetical protein
MTLYIDQKASILSDLGRGPMMINKRLGLELRNYKRELEEKMPLSLTPMESYDLELDNINSNVRQGQSYMKEVSRLIVTK